MVRAEDKTSLTNGAAIVSSEVRKLAEATCDIVCQLVHFFRIDFNSESMSNYTIRIKPLEFAGKFRGHASILLDQKKQRAPRRTPEETSD